jgi:heptosyltransferase-2
MSEQSQKILIRGVNWIGDAVLTIPAIRSIRKAFPGSHISLLVKPWVSEIFRESNDIAEIILYNNQFKGFSGKLKLAKKLRQNKFNIAILFQNAFDAAFISWLAGIPERIGYKRDWRGFLLTKAVPLKKDILKKHQLYYYLNLLKSSGIETSEIQPYIFISDDERQWARNIIQSSLPEHQLPLIGINPGATYGSAKRWPSERFADLIDKILNELNGRVIIFGSPSEIEIAKEIVEMARAQTADDGRRSTFDARRVLIMTGKTSLRGLTALISECDAFITNDSGPMHIASALLMPIVAIFGSTNKATTGPFGQPHKVISKNLSCAPCMKRKCPKKHLKCMTEITADEVFDALKEMLPHKRAIFLDRDGTIIEDKNYLNKFDAIEIFPDAKESLQKLKNSGFKLIGITNQSGIARGIVDKDFVRKSNIYLKDKLGIDDFYYCHHHPDEHCACRKPEPMLILIARIKHMIRLRDSYVIGDKESDVLLAKKTGGTGILLSSHPVEDTSASHVAKDLSDAVSWILNEEKTK